MSAFMPRAAAVFMLAAGCVFGSGSAPASDWHHSMASQNLSTRDKLSADNAISKSVFVCNARGRNFKVAALVTPSQNKIAERETDKALAPLESLLDENERLMKEMAALQYPEEMLTMTPTQRQAYFQALSPAEKKAIIKYQKEHEQEYLALEQRFDRNFGEIQRVIKAGENRLPDSVRVANLAGAELLRQALARVSKLVSGAETDIKSGDHFDTSDLQTRLSHDFNELMVSLENGGFSSRVELSVEEISDDDCAAETQTHTGQGMPAKQSQGGRNLARINPSMDGDPVHHLRS